MNWRKGSARVALVYFGFWLLVAMLGYWRYARAQNEWLTTSRNDPSDYHGLMFWDRQMSAGLDWLMIAVTGGVVVPIVAAILAAIGWWVWRGFRSTS